MTSRKGLDQLERVTVASRAEWREWLHLNHAQSQSIWLVRFKKAAGQRYVPYSDIVDEALCFGWIDSLPRKLDELRPMLLLSPRKPGSAWSKINKDKVARLIEQGLMTAAGVEKIDQAKADGSWDALNAVDALIIPDDLQAALACNAPAHQYFGRFPPSSRRGILEWIASAKQAGTRARRIAETVRLAERNLKANHPEGRNQGPKD